MINVSIIYPFFNFVYDGKYRTLDITVVTNKKITDGIVININNHNIKKIFFSNLRTSKNFREI